MTLFASADVKVDALKRIQLVTKVIKLLDPLIVPS